MNPSSNIIGYRRNGCPIRLIRGASPDGDPKSGEAGKAQGEGQAGTDGAKQDAGSEKDTPLGDGGLKALQTERDARKTLEKQIQDIQQAQQSQMAALAKAFGLTEKESKDTDIVATLQAQVAQMQHSAAVYRVAAENSITDKDDLELLKSAKDEETMVRLAARFAVSAKEEGEQKPGKPKPDRSAGSGLAVKGGGEDGRAEALKRFGKQKSAAE
jgi:hypothetical protein